jgi:hypothetical protein
MITFISVNSDVPDCVELGAPLPYTTAIPSYDLTKAYYEDWLRREMVLGESS